MAEKTLVLKVDLECSRCRQKIGRILGKLQGKENIKTIIYDEKNNTVIVSGLFDPEKLSAKLQCQAGKVIKDIQIKENKEKEKEKPKESKPAAAAPAEKEKPKTEEKKKEEKPAEKKKDEKPAEKERKPEKDDKPAEKKPEKDEKPAKSEPETSKKTEPVPSPQFPQPACCPAPYYEGYYGGMRCAVCGSVFGYTMAPPYGPYYAPPYDGYRVYHISAEEDPSASNCTIM